MFEISTGNTSKRAFEIMFCFVLSILLCSFYFVWSSRASTGQNVGGRSTINREKIQDDSKLRLQASIKCRIFGCQYQNNDIHVSLTYANIIAGRYMLSHSHSCLTNTHKPLHSENTVVSHQNSYSILNGTSLWINEFMALGHVPYDLPMLELLSLVKVDRIIIQRAPCDHPTLCLIKDPWESWFKGFYTVLRSLNGGSVLVYARSYGNESEWKLRIPHHIPQHIESGPPFIQVNSTTCFDTVFTRGDRHTFHLGVSKIAANRFRAMAVSFSLPPASNQYFNISGSKLDEISKPLIITIAHRGALATRHLTNYAGLREYLVSSLRGVNKILIRPRSSFPSNIIVRSVDTADMRTYGTFEAQVRVAAESTVLIAEHGAFQTNMMFMSNNSLLIDLRGTYKHPSFADFENLARLFDVHMVPVIAGNMRSHERQRSFEISENEMHQVALIITTYLSSMFGPFGS